GRPRPRENVRADAVDLRRVDRDVTMASFAYTAINAQGLELLGEVNAPDVSAAREQLRLRGLLAQDLREKPASGEEGVRTAFKKIKPKSLQIFSRQFATMIEAGLNVVSALVILEEQTDDKYLAAIISELRADVEGGLLLSQAMGRHPKVFSRLYVSMVEAGEAAGILDQVLDRVAFQIEKETQIKRRVKGAMIYPTMVLIFATLVLIGMLMFLVPVFVGIFDQLGGQLPTLTQWVVNASNLLRDKYYIIFPALAAAIFGIRRYKRTESGRQLWDRIKLKIPMKIGQVVLKVTMARFSRTLSTLVAAGVDIIKALEITGSTSGNWVVEEALSEVRAKVHEGVPIATPLIENPVFPPMVSQMVKIGEETGELEKMLAKIADFYEDEVDASIQSLTSIIEPIMMLLVGLMVGVIIIAMYLPMFKMLSLIGGEA
ncbi:MAG: type II secretion system F family protein, partial [Actinomycetota bacterium]|nr:type II secretion system F family protein [Actinomycetota bacterium]